MTRYKQDAQKAFTTSFLFLPPQTSRQQGHTRAHIFVKPEANPLQHLHPTTSEDQDRPFFHRGQVCSK